MTLRTLIITINLLILAELAHSTTYYITPTDDFNRTVKGLQPGDSLVLRNGVWKDVQLTFTTSGTATAPITLTTETKGKVTLEGQSNIRFSGEHLNITGLVFINGYTATGTVIEMRTSSTKVANNCTIEECVIYNYNQPDKSVKDAWVSLYGKNNSVKQCYFAGKTNQGTMLIVWPDGELNNRNSHHIYRNYFGQRPPLGANGGETIRIGTSHVSQDVSGSIVEANYFERCNGEIEIISVKSCENKIINNTFFECRGTMTLRHGHRNEVAGNFFHGNGVPGTGGIRIINEGHRVYNNFLYRLTGKDFYSALSIMNTIANSPLNGYHQVKDVVVTNNTILDCVTPFAFCVGKGERERDVRPENTVVANNIVVCPEAEKAIYEYDNTDGIALRNNLLITANGVERGIGRIASNPVPFIWTEGIEGVLANTKAEPFSFITTGITGCTPASGLRIGCFQGCQTAPIATAQNAGPQWFKTQLKAAQPIVKAGRIIQVLPGKDNLYNALRKAQSGDIIELVEGEYINSRRSIITTHITIRANTNMPTRPSLRIEQEGTTASMFELTEKCRLELQGVDINGAASSANPTKYAFITSKDSPREFTLIVDNCVIGDFASVSNGGAIYQAYSGSFADSIVIRNSVIRNCYRGIALGAEKEEKGKYNAEFVVADNTLFEGITQYAIDYQRLGVDDSTLGGTLTVNNCVFADVYSMSGKVCIQQRGIKNIRVTNSIFTNSDAKAPIQLNLPSHYFGYNVVSDCGKVNSSVAKVERNREDRPSFKKKSFHLNEKSPLLKAGIGGTTIGLR